LYRRKTRRIVYTRGAAARHPTACLVRLAYTLWRRLAGFAVFCTADAARNFTVVVCNFAAALSAALPQQDRCCCCCCLCHVLFTLVDLISQAKELLLAVAADATLLYSDHTVYLQQTAQAKYGTSERNNMFAVIQQSLRCNYSVAGNSWLTDSGLVACWEVLAVWLIYAIHRSHADNALKPMNLGLCDITDSRIPCFPCILFTHFSFALYLTVVCSHNWIMTYLERNWRIRMKIYCAH